jgi:2-polyprenyl-6-methoxyphenol hydroxylase-like FAD-dependent oxidoreductase
MSASLASLASGAKRNLRIAVCGGGIGGLATSLALQRFGFRPVVIERASWDALSSEGLFLTMAPNGINALRAVDLAEAVVASGIVTTGIALKNERGRELGLTDFGRHGSRFGAPSVTIRRGVLWAVLAQAAQTAGIELRFEQSVTGVSSTREVAEVEIEGRRERYDMAIGCDGIRSTVRAAIFPKFPRPSYSGLIGTGGFSDADSVPPTTGTMVMTFGKRAFFGYIKAADSPVYWFNSYPAPESDVAPVKDGRAYARTIAAMHREDPSPNPEILARVEEIERSYPIYDMPRLPTWSQGNVVLLGDAAHAVAPHSGQGASLAIEDGVVLAACLATADKPSDAFRRFEALRQKRAETAIRIGRMVGSQKLTKTWLARRMRDLMLPLVLPMGARTQERLYGFRADQAPLAQPSQ